MAEGKFDLVVVGSGPGGYVAAIRAAQLGMKTAVVEKENVGGRCLNEACIPAKSILRVAEVMEEVHAAKSFGISVNGTEFDYSGAVKHRDKVVKTLTGGVSMLFDKNKIQVFDGFGALTEDGNVRIGADKDGEELETDKVLLACGSVAKPLLDLKFGKRILDTAGMWLLNEQPKKLAVIGAGASGTEIASAFGRLGTEVVLLEALDQILPLEDEEISKACAREIKKQNVRIETGAKVEQAEASDDGVRVTFNGETEDFDYLVIEVFRLAVEGHPHAVVGSLGLLDLCAGLDAHVLLLDLARAGLRDLLVLEWQDLVERLEQHDLGAKAAEGGGDLGARGAGADYGELLGLLVEQPHARGVEDALAELQIEQRLCHRAAGQQHALGLELLAVLLGADAHVAVVGQRAETLEQLDLVLVEQHAHPAGERLHDLVAVLGGPAVVELGAVHGDAEALRVPHLLHHLGH